MSQRRRVKIASGCKTEEQFVAVFNRFCDGESIFIATRTPKAVGETLQFALTLADGKTLLAGTGSVSECYRDKSGPFSRPGMRITFSELDDQSTPMLTRLTEAKASAEPKQKSKPAKRPEKPEKATVLGVPPIRPVAAPAVAMTPPAEAAGDDPPPLQDSGTKKTFGLPPPVVEPPTRPERPGRAASVDESWDDETTDVKTPTPLPRARTPRALGSESESSDGMPDSRLQKLGDIDRTPGPGFVLPANPFGELESASLEHFIECTIYEERASTNEMFGGLDDSGERAVVPANPLATIDDHDSDVVAGVVGDDDDDEPAVVLDTPPPQVAIPAPVLPPPMSTRPVTVSPSTQVQIGDRSVPLLWLVGGAVAVVLIAGLILGYLIWGGGSASSEDAPADPGTTLAAAAIAVDAGITGAMVDAAPVVPRDALEPERAIQPCSIEASAEPEGASVSVGGETIGETPGTFEVPCGEIAVTLDHPRYKKETRTVTAAPGEPASVDGHLERPRFRLRIRTRPAGARITVDGRRVGTSPLTLTVNGFERQRVAATKRGYRKASRRVYLKKNGGVTLNLKRNNVRNRSPRRRR